MGLLLFPVWEDFDTFAECHVFAQSPPDGAPVIYAINTLHHFRFVYKLFTVGLLTVIHIQCTHRHIYMCVCVCVYIKLRTM